ncbi:MAG: class I SAM-dependent RNA methyltransferase [Caulobacteraceae bacterium]
MTITASASRGGSQAAGEVAILEIQAMGARGDGVAGPVFAPFTLSGERVRARIAAGRAEAAEILRPSGERVAPPCPHFGDCGGCALQHWAHAPYLAWKSERIRLALGRVGIETEILAPFAAPPGSRRRLALHARREGGGAVLGFKARRSWRLAAIEVCTIADPRLVAAFPALRRLAAPFLEQARSAPILHVTLTDTGMDVEVTGVERRGGGLSADARLRVARLAGEADMARVTLAGETVYLGRAPTVRLGPATVALPPGAFLQAVPAAERAMAEFVARQAAGARRIADLYCGVGTFSFHLASLAPVIAADASAPAVAALRAALASAPGLHPIAAEARDLDRRPLLAEDLKKVDVALFDPPRAGAQAQCAQLARSAVSRAIGVSCDLGTFARDAATLTGAGFRLDRLLPVDQFLWSPHIELVGVFSR